MHLADSTKNEYNSINKHSDNLKNWSVKMPNAPYSNRCKALKKTKEYQLK